MNNSVDDLLLGWHVRIFSVRGDVSNEYLRLLRATKATGRAPKLVSFQEYANPASSWSGNLGIGS